MDFSLNIAYLWNGTREVPARRPSQSISSAAFEDSDDTRIYWLAGAGFLIHSRRTNILIDPVLSLHPDDPGKSEANLPLKVMLPLRAEDVPENCTVLYTHVDKDHLGPLTAKILAEKGIRMVGTLAVFEKLARLGVAPSQIDVLRIYEKMTVGEIPVEATAADHPWQLKDLKRGGRPYRMGECCGFILTVPEGRLFFPGDTRLMEEHLRIENIDLLALDVSTDEFHINHVCGPVLANHFPGAALLPFHYGTYDCPDISAHVGEPEEVYPAIENAGQRGYIVSPGESIVLK